MKLWSCVLGALLAFHSSALNGDDSTEAKDGTPIKISGKQSAPEFEDIAEWVNSKPLRMKDLKGKVVVIHFMAFG